MIEAVIFDVDGVLVESMVFARVLDERFGITRKMTAAFFDGPFKSCVLGQARLRQVLPPYLREWNWKGSVEDFIQTWFEADARTNPEMLNLVSKLRAAGLKCYVASTQEASRADYLEHEMGLGKRFDGLFFSCRLGWEKPAPAFYQQIASHIDVAPASILFFDDSQPNVEGARAAGWNAETYQIGDDIQALISNHQFQSAPRSFCPSQFP